MAQKKKKPGWFVKLDSKNTIIAIVDQDEKLIASFDKNAPASFRAALAKNVFWVQGCIKNDLVGGKFKWEKSLPNLPIFVKELE